jgi:hypothetical protein
LVVESSFVGNTAVAVVAAGIVVAVVVVVGLRN